jgi:hypothetical protein
MISGSPRAGSAVVGTVIEIVAIDSTKSLQIRKVAQGRI